MISGIEAVFLDVGNTLRILVKDEAHQAAARRRIAELVEARESPEALYERLDWRYKIYRKWAFETLIEAPEYELWTRFLLPDYPLERIGPLSGELTYQFRQSFGRRVLQNDAREVILELHRRGYCLGIISNVITAREIPDWLEADGFSPYFRAVVLSSVFGRRKPHPSIYQEAARQAGVAAARCVYVGDNPARDVTGTRQAGFGMTVLLIDPQDAGKAPDPLDEPADVVIQEFRQLLDIFPERQPVVSSMLDQSA